MQSQTLKVVRVGNSRGVRLPAPLLAHYRIGHAVVAERTADGILLRPTRDGRLSWDDTFRATGAEQRKNGDEFSVFDAAMTQAHAFKAAELGVKAQMAARRLA